MNRHQLSMCNRIALNINLPDEFMESDTVFQKNELSKNGR